MWTFFQWNTIDHITKEGQIVQVCFKYTYADLPVLKRVCKKEVMYMQEFVYIHERALIK